jgi:hypothetical protein
MRSIMGIFQLICLLFLVSSCQKIGEIDVETSSGDGASWPGWAQISLQKKTYEVNESIKITIRYGHDYQGDAADHGIISHDVVLFVIDGNSQLGIDPKHGTIIYEQSISGDDLLSEAYRCDPGKWIFSRVEYLNAFEIAVDFQAYDFDSGLLVISFYETFNHQDNIDGEIVDTETTHVNSTMLYFLKDDETIQFSKRSFA